MRARTEGANRPSGGAGEGGPPIRHVILAEGLFDLEWSKTAACIIRYQPGRVAAVLDSTQAGRDAAAVIGYGAGIPVLADLEEALALDPPPTSLLLGIAPQGGALPDEWRRTIEEAIGRGLDVWSGLHTFLGDDPESDEDKYELCRISVENGELEKLGLKMVGAYVNMSTHPDGRHIIFSSTKKQIEEVWVMENFLP